MSAIKSNQGLQEIL